eukprot:8016294-Pyramimonas_sp.AAC.1
MRECEWLAPAESQRRVGHTASQHTVAHAQYEIGAASTGNGSRMSKLKSRVQRHCLWHSGLGLEVSGSAGITDLCSARAGRM